ncbi:MAG: GntR family transcriptional regulator [Pseudomonadota bacterium]
MDIVIDLDNPKPPFTQLMAQIKQAVASRSLLPGDPLPSIRQLASDLELNSKTVAKAYRLLERDSVIQSRGYRGSFVHPDATDNCTVDLDSWLQTQLSESVQTFRDAGVTDAEIRLAFSRVMSDRND